MTHKPSPYDVQWAVEDAAEGAVREAVYWPLEEAVDRAVRVRPPHPNLDRLLTEIRQSRGCAT